MNFATLHFDTYKVVNLLMGKGYSKDEAEGFIEAIQEVTLSGVATKHDIDDLKEAMNELRLATKNDVDELRQEMTEFKLSVRQDIDNVRSELLKFQIIQTLAIIGLMFAMFQYFT